MTALFRPALVLLLALTLITGVAYPLVVTGIAQAVFPSQAGGSIVIRDGKAVGSRLIGQSFTDPKHFWSRPSATAPQPYNGLAGKHGLCDARDDQWIGDAGDQSQCQ